MTRDAAGCCAGCQLRVGGRCMMGPLPGSGSLSHSRCYLLACRSFDYLDAHLTDFGWRQVVPSGPRLQLVGRCMLRGCLLARPLLPWPVTNKPPTCCCCPPGTGARQAHPSTGASLSGRCDHRVPSYPDIRNCGGRVWGGTMAERRSAAAAHAGAGGWLELGGVAGGRWQTLEVELDAPGECDGCSW